MKLTLKVVLPKFYLWSIIICLACMRYDSEAEAKKLRLWIKNIYTYMNTKNIYKKAP
jgi:hypothetical protein